ncbi:MAG: hypothetical protein ACYDAO_03845 [Thermoplasmataceae archaeon]
MKLDEKNIYDLFASLRVIGDPEYGGTGSIKENILVGYIYGILSENEESVIRVDREDMKIIKSGLYSYIVWFDDPDESFETEEGFEKLDIEPMEEYHTSENNDLGLIPVAIEGPFTDREIIELIHEGAI